MDPQHDVAVAPDLALAPQLPDPIYHAPCHSPSCDGRPELVYYVYQDNGSLKRVEGPLHSEQAERVWHLFGGAPTPAATYDLVRMVSRRKPSDDDDDDDEEPPPLVDAESSDDDGEGDGCVDVSSDVARTSSVTETNASAAPTPSSE